jgi:hypothetical protein
MEFPEYNPRKIVCKAKSKRICVSVSEEEYNFLEMNNLSPSELLHWKIAELNQNFQQFAAKQVEELNKKIKNLVELHENLQKFIDKKGLTDEFLKMEGFL